MRRRFSGSGAIGVSIRVHPSGSAVVSYSSIRRMISLHPGNFSTLFFSSTSFLCFSSIFSSIFCFYFLFLFFIFLLYFPTPQFGKVQTEQFKHSPPSPNSASSSAVILSSAIIRGSARSKIVLFAYITQPGNPMIGIFPL